MIPQNTKVGYLRRDLIHQIPFQAKGITVAVAIDYHIVGAHGMHTQRIISEAADKNLKSARGCPKCRAKRCFANIEVAKTT